MERFSRHESRWATSTAVAINVVVLASRAAESSEWRVARVGSQQTRPPFGTGRPRTSCSCTGAAREQKAQVYNVDGQTEGWQARPQGWRGEGAQLIDGAVMCRAVERALVLHAGRGGETAGEGGRIPLQKDCAPFAMS
jgi:hypothetical protein